MQAACVAEWKTEVRFASRGPPRCGGAHVGLELPRLSAMPSTNCLIRCRIVLCFLGCFPTILSTILIEKYLTGTTSKLFLSCSPETPHHVN